MSNAEHHSELPATVGATLARLREDATGPGILAVSGGADSVALLRALDDDPPAGGLVVAHLNHRLRGTESDADAQFVAELCPCWPHRVEAIDVRAAAEPGENLEAAARRVRYDFLARVARAAGASWVATAHTLDDQAETILHRLIRGTGLRGLRGIAERRPLVPEVQLLRPMLTVCRAEVIAYLREIGQDWREDATNLDPTFTRNRIRHELLPLLRTFNPAIADVLGRLAAQAEEVFGDVETVVRSLLARAELPRAGRVCLLDRTALADADRHLLRELLHLLWDREGWPRGDMTASLWARAAGVIRGESPAWDLPGGIRIAYTLRVVRIGPVADLPS